MKIPPRATRGRGYRPSVAFWNLARQDTVEAVLRTVQAIWQEQEVAMATWDDVNGKLDTLKAELNQLSTDFDAWQIAHTSGDQAQIDNADSALAASLSTVTGIENQLQPPAPAAGTPTGTTGAAPVTPDAGTGTTPPPAP